jgi:hypothetical protein
LKAGCRLSPESVASLELKWNVTYKKSRRKNMRQANAQ